MAANTVGQTMDEIVLGEHSFPDIAHVVLTVTDLDRSVPWYAALFGENPNHVLEGEPFRAAVWTLPSVTVALHEFVHQVGKEPFDEQRTGLDHLAFRCTPRRHRRRTVPTGASSTPGPRASMRWASPGSGLSFRDPDNIALEFFAPPPPPSDRFRRDQ